MPGVQVTCYQRGQYQRLHFDARPAGDPDGLKQFLQVCLLQGPLVAAGCRPEAAPLWLKGAALLARMPGIVWNNAAGHPDAMVVGQRC